MRKWPPPHSSAQAISQRFDGSAPLEQRAGPPWTRTRRRGGPICPPGSIDVGYATAMTAVQYLQRFAAAKISLRHSGHSRRAGGASSGFLKRCVTAFIGTTTKK